MNFTKFLIWALIAIAMAAGFLIGLRLVNGAIKLSKQRRYFKDLHLRLQTGVNVELSDGRKGTVTSVSETNISLLIGRQTITVSRYAVAKITDISA